MTQKKETSRAWVAKVVIGLNLCPFAQKPFIKNQVRFKVIFENTFKTQLLAFWEEVELLSNTDKNKISNTILILPNGLNDFQEYLKLYELAEQLLIEQKKENEFQLASFHPGYQFENTKKDDVSNYTNRSPFPFIHILRTEEVREAISNYPDIEKVPVRNIETMQRIGLEGIKNILEEIKKT
ncbi:MAG TPA: DUF1415 domain-containing protein [Bacteroidetes bacterium]|nr:DUF1415 domain-containing protein [Bacteroidota bacterium]